MFGPATERLQQLAFAGDSVGGWTILRKGVAAARFGIAPLQLRARAVDKERGDIIAFARAQFLDAPDGASGIKTARAAVNAKRERTVGIILSLRQRGVEQAVEEQQREVVNRSEEHTSELQSLMRKPYAVFYLKQTKTEHTT